MVGLGHDAGVVVEDVEPSEALDGVVDHGAGVVLPRDIGLHEAGLAAGIGDLADGLLARIGRELRDNDLGTLRREHLGRDATHPAPRAGDHRDLAVEPHQPRSR